MKIREVMTNPVIQIRPEEPVSVAARTLARYNIGSLPVCGSDGRVCGLVTDRDIVTRCLAAGRSPASTTVADVMTGRVISAAPDMDTGAAAHLMGREQVRRLPPREGIDRVHHARNLQVLRRRLIGVLSLPREEEVGVLQGECQDFHLVPLCHKLPRQPLVVSRNTATAVGP